MDAVRGRRKRAIDEVDGPAEPDKAKISRLGAGPSVASRVARQCSLLEAVPPEMLQMIADRLDRQGFASLSTYIVKIGVGIYAKAKKSVLSGRAIPVKPVGVLAPVALRKLGIEVYPSLATQEYNSGATTQVPAGNVLNIGNQRVVRKIGFGQQSIVYEKNNGIPARAD